MSSNSISGLNSRQPPPSRLPPMPLANVPQQKKVELIPQFLPVYVVNNNNISNVRENEEKKSIFPITEVEELPPPLPLSLPPELPSRLPPEYEEEGIVNLPHRPDESHLDALVLDKIKIWKNKRFSAQYVLLTYKDKIEKSVLMAFLKKYCNEWLIEIDEKDKDGNTMYGIRIAHESICKDGVYRPHTHVYLEFRGRMPKVNKHKEFFKIFGVEAPDIRMIGERREGVIAYLMKEDTEIEPIVVLGVDGEKKVMFVDAVPDFPVKKLGEKWQRSLWDFFVGKEWDENMINYVVERKNGRDRNDFINSFDTAYNILIIDEKTINDDTLLAKKISSGLGTVRALTRQKDATRYVIIDMVGKPDEACLKRIKNLQSGKSRGGKNSMNDGFGPPRVLVFSRRSMEMKIGVRRVDRGGGVMWNISGVKVVNVESDYFKDLEWNLGVIYEESVYKVLDWQLRRSHSDWEEEEYGALERLREVKEEKDEDDKAMKIFYRMIKNVKWASYQIEKEEGMNNRASCYNGVNPFAIKPELKMGDNGNVWLNRKIGRVTKPNEYLADIKERWGGFVRENGYEVDN